MTEISKKRIKEGDKGKSIFKKIQEGDFLVDRFCSSVTNPFPYIP